VESVIQQFNGSEPVTNLLKKTDLPFSCDLLEKLAEEKLETGPFTYVQSGAGSESTLRANIQAFENYRIVPRVLRDVSRRNGSTKVLNIELQAPFLLAPVGMQGIVHPEGELASARAASSLGIPYIASTVSTYSLEEIAEALGDTPRWFQLYWTCDPELTFSLVRRAEQAGYSAIVITVDTPVLGFRARDLNNDYFPLKLGKGAGNFFHDPVFRSRLRQPPEEDFEGAIQYLLDVIFHPSLTWEQIHQLKKQTSLPILIKGVLHKEDAEKALGYGLDGIIVSNHGGRQLDGCISSLEALPSIVEVIQEKIPVLLDSGIRRGVDVIIARALGASAVLLGRPYVYGLAVEGEEGVKHVLESFMKDIDISLALSGVSELDQVDSSLICK
jgi:lactate 2-monooxygenase